MTYTFILYIESEILKNTHWDILHIFTSEDIDRVTFSCFSAWHCTIFAWDYIQNGTLHGGLKIRLFNIIFSCWKQYFTHSLRSFVKYCFHHSKIKVIYSRRRVISSIYLTIIPWVHVVYELITICGESYKPYRTRADGILVL